MRSVLINFTFIIFSLIFENGNASCMGDFWAVYKDEKCYKILDEFVSAEEAYDLCFDLTRDKSPLLTIKTAEEQAFLNKFIYEDSQIVDNIWLDAKRINGTNNFQWDADKSEVDFTNWAADAPSNTTEQNCVHMTSRLSKSGDLNAEGDGHWTDGSCQRRNLVVCQKLQQLSVYDIQRIIFENRLQISKLKTAIETIVNIMSQNGIDVSVDSLLK